MVMAQIKALAFVTCVLHLNRLKSDRTVLCVDIYIQKTIHHIIRKDLEEKLGIFASMASHHYCISRRKGWEGIILLINLLIR